MKDSLLHLGFACGAQQRFLAHYEWKATTEHQCTEYIAMDADPSNNNLHIYLMSGCDRDMGQ